MPSRSPSTAAQDRLQEALAEHIQSWIETTPTVSRVHAAKVTSVAAGGAADGSALVQISVGGTASFVAPYLSSYTPVVGHIVAVTRTGASVVILGRIVGNPP